MVDLIHKNFLRSVILRIDFASPIDEIEKKIPAELAKSVRKNFPICEIHRVAEGEVKFELKIDQPDVKTTKKTEEIYNQWRYFGDDKQKILEIDKKHFALVYKNYNAFPEFQKDYNFFISLICENFKGIEFVRVGIRYINEIKINEANPIDWSKYLNNNLLTIFKVSPEPDKISRAFHVLSLNFSEFKINFQYGMPNPDFPAPIKQKIFILDFDAFHDGIVDNKDIEKYIFLFRKEIKNLFKSSIKKALKDKMK